MGIVHVSPGDQVHVTLNGTTYEFTVQRNDEGGVEFAAPILCEACGVNDASDYELQGRHMCPRCVERALQFMAYDAALHHLMDNDDELANALRVLREIDAANAGATYQYVHSHFSAMDQVWALRRDEMNEMLRNITESIRDVFDARTLVDRP